MPLSPAPTRPTGGPTTTRRPGPIVSAPASDDASEVGAVAASAASAAATSQPMLIGDPPSAPFDGPVLSTDQKRLALATLDDSQVKGCKKCRLCDTRAQTVFGEGDVDARIFFIGEGPGENEDLTGRPFVGRAGQLLDRMIAGMGLSRAQVFIANIVKCRPPDNRVPMPDEVETCTPYLVKQIEIVRPKVIVTLGLPSTKYMLQSKLSMGKLRGTWQSWRGIKLMPTFHPAYLLRAYTDENRALVWSDLKQALVGAGLPVPARPKPGAEAEGK
jgi:DNA polymerase